MNYHNITTDDMLNGSGLRVCLWLSACNHYCKGCHNPQTWNPESGIEFDVAAKNELFQELDKEHISGVTFSGGDPFHPVNRKMVADLCVDIRKRYPKSQKNIWIYTGYSLDELFNEADSDAVIMSILINCDVLVDGRYNKDKSDVNYPWAGSTNQRVINIPATLKRGEIVLW